MATEDQEQPQRPTKLFVIPATFLALDPAAMTAEPSQRFLIMSLEREPGKIEQIGFTHDDGQVLLSALLEGLKAQGSAAAKLLLDVLSDIYDQNDEEGEDGNDNDDDGGDLGIIDDDPQEEGASAGEQEQAEDIVDRTNDTGEYGIDT